ncbi:hypothetical protein SR882_08780 [Guyparkeria halophila]|uniref:Secreted protein n=1 Tax=Guyparkeria halophila TaxID=47960 RepID=A0ABZ0YV18_9GAMM|nr:hypothetical protein [Guyparkeria halophila]WQH15848.1 hypothetical protein SR882_08780 [Guyparkeria halophila]
MELAHLVVQLLDLVAHRLLDGVDVLGLLDLLFQLADGAPEHVVETPELAATLLGLLALVERVLLDLLHRGFDLVEKQRELGLFLLDHLAHFVDQRHGAVDQEARVGIELVGAD